MSSLSNESLFEAYIKAKKLKLADDFIAIIDQELKKRGIHCQFDVIHSFKVVSS